MVGKAERVTLEVLKQHFHMPMQDVAKKFDVCVTFFKRICRMRGVKRWPYRKLKSLQKKACDDDEYEQGYEDTMAHIAGSDSDGAHESLAGIVDEDSVGTLSEACSASSVDESVHHRQTRARTRSPGAAHARDVEKASPTGLDLLALVAVSTIEEESKCKTEEVVTEEQQRPPAVLPPGSVALHPSSCAAAYEMSRVPALMTRSDEDAFLAQANAQLLQHSLMQHYPMLAAGAMSVGAVSYAHSAAMHPAPMPAAMYPAVPALSKPPL